MKKRLTAKTMVELRVKVYANEGWQRQFPENITARIKTKYDLSMDMVKNVFVATRKDET